MQLGPNQLKFVEALESGKYQQTTGVLRRGDCFCVLGVASDVCGAKWTKYTDSSYETDGCTRSLPAKVIAFFGFFDNWGAKMHSPRSLASMNDNGMTFPKIAEEIRENPAHFFRESH